MDVGTLMVVGGVVLIVAGFAFIVGGAVPSLAEAEWRRSQRVKDRLPRRQQWAANLPRRTQRVYLAVAGAAVTALGFYGVLGLDHL